MESRQDSVTGSVGLKIGHRLAGSQSQSGHFDQDRVTRSFEFNFGTDHRVSGSPKSVSPKVARFQHWSEQAIGISFTAFKQLCLRSEERRREDIGKKPAETQFRMYHRNIMTVLSRLLASDLRCPLVCLPPNAVCSMPPTVKYIFSARAHQSAEGISVKFMGERRFSLRTTYTKLSERLFANCKHRRTVVLSY